MSGLVYHGALAPLADAVAELPGDVRFISNLLDSGSVSQPLVRKTILLFRHVGLALKVLFAPKSASFFIREFSNIPLAFVFPLIRSSRARLFFLVNHNLQWTLESSLEKAAFSKLASWGCRFVFFEQVPELSPSGHRSTLFHPVPDTPFVRIPRAFGAIGVIGQYRPEKGIDELLRQLEPLAGKYRIVLALPNPDAFHAESRFAKADWLTCRDTLDYDEYLRTISECDVIVLNHPAQGYEYRASGLIADAASAHVPVIVRNLPVLASQVTHPVCVGETFGDFTELPGCIERVAKQLAEKPFAFEVYKDARSGAKLIEKLAEVVGS